MKKELKRSFGGKLSGFVDRQEEAIEKKHLASYLKGQMYFKHGIDEKSKKPKWFTVNEIWS